MANATMSEERMKALFESYQKGGGRPLETLLTTKDKLKGSEAQTLRGHFTSYGFHPVDCKDFEWSAALFSANLVTLEKRFDQDVQAFGGGAEGIQKTITKWEIYRDSPNKLPLYDILQIGAWTDLVREGKIKTPHYKALDWLISKGISVEGTDVAGYTALQHTLTCTPLQHDIEKWSTTLLAASKDKISAINHRNRYGTTAIHETFQSFRRPGETELRLEVVRWQMDRGANVDIPDGDGSTARTTANYYPNFKNIIAEYDHKLASDGGCEFCREGGVAGKGKGAAVKDGEGPSKATLRCGQCKNRIYCSLRCQKLDWPSHKPKCSPPKAPI